MTYSYTEIHSIDGVEFERVEKQGHLETSVTLDRLTEILANHTPRKEYDIELNQIHTDEQPLEFAFVFLKGTKIPEDQILFTIKK